MLSGVESNLAPLLYRADGRKQARTHLFVAASLIAGLTSIPVRIRNMSPSGALIECNDPPFTNNDKVILRRGLLEVSARVAWIESGRAGLAFDAAVNVGEWMARIGSVGQSKIDAMIADLRSSPSRYAEMAPQKEPNQVTGQLQDIRDQLARLADALLEDEQIIIKHPEIQIFDIVLQKLDRLIRD